MIQTLNEDRAPYTDFAVWGPYGRRQTKHMKFTAQVWVGGELVTRQLTGPANFEAWRAPWRVFRAAMILLGACLPGPLDEYEENIRALAIAHRCRGLALKLAAVCGTGGVGGTGRPVAWGVLAAGEA